ncbi:MAG: hypothetical protein WAV47_04610 [Blastocatellia bacterium]
MQRCARINSGFCLCLAALMGAACTLPATASKPPENVSKVPRIGDVPPRKSWYKLQFVNELEGYLGNGKDLWRTADGGKSWELAYSGEGSWAILDSIKSVEIVNSRTGWMLVDKIYRTEDGGDTWKKLSDPDMVVHSIHLMEGGKRGWAAGEMYRPISARDAGVRSQLVSSDGKKVLYPALFHTEDGGSTWTRQSLPSSEGRLLHLCFLDEAHRWASSDGEFFYLESYSNSWKLANYSSGKCPNRILLETTQGNSESGVVCAPAAIYFLDANQGWLSFRNGYMAKSSDGGRTWCDLLNPRDVWPTPTWQTFFSKIYFSTAMHGWGLGADGSLQETNDGGGSWRKMDLDARFEDMFFREGGHGWAVAKEGLFSISP